MRDRLLEKEKRSVYILPLHSRVATPRASSLIHQGCLVGSYVGMAFGEATLAQISFSNPHQTKFGLVLKGTILETFISRLVNMIPNINVHQTITIVLHSFILRNLYFLEVNAACAKRVSK